jgi:MFS superfamily sulfate permease-like transporter
MSGAFAIAVLGAIESLLSTVVADGMARDLRSSLLRCSVFLMDEVHAMDATALVAFESAPASLGKHRCLAILTGIRAQPMATLAQAAYLKVQGSSGGRKSHVERLAG